MLEVFKNHVLIARFGRISSILSWSREARKDCEEKAAGLRGLRPALQLPVAGLKTGHYMAGSGAMPTGIGISSFAVFPFRKVEANRIAETMTQSQANQSPN